MVTDEARGVAPFQPLEDTSAWEELLRRSEQLAVVLFKHDPYCSISAAAHDQMARLHTDVALVDVAHQSALAQRIAHDTGVRHESPQVIVLRDQKPAWSASHWKITADAVQQVLEASS